MAALNDDDVCPWCGKTISAEGAKIGECPHCTGSLQNWLCSKCEAENEAEYWPVCHACKVNNDPGGSPRYSVADRKAMREARRNAQPPTQALLKGVAEFNAGVPRRKAREVTNINGVQTDEDYFEARFAEIPPDVLVKAVEHFRSLREFWPLDEFRKLFEKYGLHEWFMHVYDDQIERMKAATGGKLLVPIHPHSTFGMGLRNALRGDAGLPDSMLPLGNWDDYYVSVLEAALDFRHLPEREQVGQDGNASAAMKGQI